MNCLRLGAGYLRIQPMLVNLFRPDFFAFLTTLPLAAGRRGLAADRFAGLAGRPAPVLRLPADVAAAAGRLPALPAGFEEGAAKEAAASDNPAKFAKKDAYLELAE